MAVTKNIKIKIVRACIVNGEHANEGQVFDLPEPDAKYLVGIKKAELVEDKPVDKKSAK